MENRTDILNELKQLSPLLAQREKLNLFSVPENYFSSVEAQVMEKIYVDSVSAELHHTGLKGLEKQEVFNVPYGYFERLPNEMLSKTSRKPTVTVWESVIEYFQHSFRLTPIFAAAPALAVMILAILSLNDCSWLGLFARSSK